MELDDILPGCKLDVVEPKIDPDGKNKGINHSYKSSLYSILDNNHIEIMTPQEETIIIPLRYGGQSYLYYNSGSAPCRWTGSETIQKRKFLPHRN